MACSPPVNVADTTFVDQIVWEACGAAASAGLHSDEMIPVGHLLPGLLSQMRVLLYNGQFDLNCGVPGTVTYLRQLQWPGLVRSSSGALFASELTVDRTRRPTT
jgi:hypothetical protein